MTDGIYKTPYDPKFLRKDQLDFEVSQVKKLVHFDARRHNYNNMTDD